MNLRSGLPYFLIKRGLPYDYPKLEKTITTEVVVVGGGISGALMAYYLTKAGVECVVVDGRSIALGSTSASTSLLQYEIDVPLVELIPKIGMRDARRAFHLCDQAIDKIKSVSKTIGIDYFRDRESLYFAASNRDTDFLQEEFKARKLAGFDVEFLDGKEIRDAYGFVSPGAIRSLHGAQIDAYTFTHDILQYSIAKGLRVYDRSRVSTIRESKQRVVVKTENGSTITARKLVNATGYEVVEFIKKKIVRLLSTYAVISEHMTHSVPQWQDDTLFWNTADPYLYMTTLDNRIMIGGRDELYYNPTKRDKLIKKKSKQLTSDFKKLFPRVPFDVEFSWAGTFGATADGLPFIGPTKNNSNIYYALGFGGNGITFSQVAAEIVTDLITGKPSRDARLFSFDRL